MTTKVAFIINEGNRQGDVAFISQPVDSTAYVEGTIYHEHTARFLPDDADIDDYLDNKYWKDNAWHTKPDRPSEAHFWDNQQWVSVDQSKFMWDKVKATRNNLLDQTDLTQIADYPITSEKKAEFAAYRQALRDIPQAQSTVTEIENIVWPTYPEL
tara:strand:+ start:3593 stop:4060 length:468 start_codon:yes stop_codon:yes gene_type:complete